MPSEYLLLDPQPCLYVVVEQDKSSLLIESTQLSNECQVGGRTLLMDELTDGVLAEGRVY